jgi:hypothetical protein
VKQGTVQVNSPLRYKGIAFHQAFYGQTAVMKVQDKTGKVVFNDGVPLAWQTREGQRPVGSFNLPEQNLSVYVVGPRSGETDPMIPAGEMRVEVYRQESRAAPPQNLTQGQPGDLAGFTFTFIRERLAGLKVVKDPGTNIIWVGDGPHPGMVMLFTTRRRLWALGVAARRHTTVPFEAAQRDAPRGTSRACDRTSPACWVPMTPTLPKETKMFDLPTTPCRGDVRTGRSVPALPGERIRRKNCPRPQPRGRTSTVTSSRTAGVRRYATILASTPSSSLRPRWRSVHR